MGGRLDPALARARSAVRAALGTMRGGSPDRLVLVAVSGGADSLALAAATAFVAPRVPLRWGAVVVDHALQDRSAAVAEIAADQAERLGADPVRTARVDFDPANACGPEAAARTARYDALARHATELGAAAVLVAHTRDDQAESVLLGLSRGSGARSLAGMRSHVEAPRWSAGGRCPLLRPFLQLARADTLAVCAAEGLTPWSDPHNHDRSYLRSRVRLEVLPVLEAQLGPGVRDALARTAELLRDDADLLDLLAAELLQRVRTSAPGDQPVLLQVKALAAAPAALRRRALRLAALAAGAPATDLDHGHVVAVDRLLTDWHGQRGLDLPGRIVARRDQGVLQLTRRPAPPARM